MERNACIAAIDGLIKEMKQKHPYLRVHRETILEFLDRWDRKILAPSRIWFVSRKSYKDLQKKVEGIKEKNFKTWLMSPKKG